MCGNTAEGIANDRADDNPSRWTPDIDETMQEYGVPLTALDGLPRADAVAGNATNPRSAYDPVAAHAARRVFAGTEGLEIVDDSASALRGADALLIVTEWKEFKSPDFDQIKSLLLQPIIFDGRNLYDLTLMRTLGIEYIGIGRSSSLCASPPHND